MDKKKAQSIFTPSRPSRLSEDIYLQLKEAILNGHYQPGERLPSEKDFCEIFGTGRPVIREALRFIENSGMISVRPGSGGGAFVQKINASILTNTLEGIFRLDKVSLQELTEARVAIELAALPLVMERIQEADLQDLQRNIDEAREALERGIRGKKNLPFHVLLVKASGNRLLTKISEALLELMSKLLDRYLYKEERSRRVLQEHEELLALLRAREYEKTRMLLESHIRNLAELFIRLRDVA